MNNQVLRSYFEESDLTVDQMSKKVSSNFPKFLTGERTPSYNQLLKIAKQLDIPLGLLLLDNTVNVSIPDLKFRTINSEYKSKKSLELLDTINEMEDKQTFLKEQIDTSLSFIGKFSIENDYMEVVDFIRNQLNLNVVFEQVKDRNSYFKLLRDRINRLGIFIFLNGKIKDNSHRSLNIDEFRGFVLLDNKAPIIFINQKDTKNGQIFTLVHELVHLLIGDEEILGNQNIQRDYDRVEAFVNKVTGEILVPALDLKASYNNTEEIQTLADKFKVSRYVIIRRLLDSKLISKAKYQGYVLKFDNEFKKLPNKKSGGDYSRNLNFRMDRNFFKYVQSALNSQKITYTDAFDIIGVGYKGYQKLKKG